MLERKTMDPIDEQISAYNSRDLERFLATYSPAIVIEDGKGNLLGKGHDLMRERYGALFEASPELHAQIVNRMRIGPYTVDEEQITGMRGSPAPFHGIVVYRVEGDKIVHVRMLI
jgi:hypothetical protein